MQQEWPLWPLLNLPLTGRAPRRAETNFIAALSIVWRIVAAIRLWRGRARSRRQLNEHNDHLLKDIGLSERTLVTICRKGSE